VGQYVVDNGRRIQYASSVDYTFDLLIKKDDVTYSFSVSFNARQDYTPDIAKIEAGVLVGRVHYVSVRDGKLDGLFSTNEPMDELANFWDGWPDTTNFDEAVLIDKNSPESKKNEARQQYARFMNEIAELIRTGDLVVTETESHKIAALPE